MDSNIAHEQKKVRVSFDFDGTVGHVPYVQRLAKSFVLDPHNDVHIVTRRYGHVHPVHGDEMTQVYNLAHHLGIVKENIHFLDRRYKVGKLKELEIDLHWDDDVTEIMLIRKHYPNCKAFLVI